METNCCENCAGSEVNHSIETIELICENAACPCHLKVGWEERFDKLDCIDEAGMTDWYKVEAFITSELSLAREEGRNEERDWAVDYIQQMKGRCDKPCVSCRVLDILIRELKARPHSKGE